MYQYTYHDLWTRDRDLSGKVPIPKWVEVDQLWEASGPYGITGHIVGNSGAKPRTELEVGTKFIIQKIDPYAGGQRCFQIVTVAGEKWEVTTGELLAYAKRI